MAIMNKWSPIVIAIGLHLFVFIRHLSFYRYKHCLFHQFEQKIHRQYFSINNESLGINEVKIENNRQA